MAQESPVGEISSVRRSEFLADLSHEVRSPLNAIIGFSDLLDNGVFGELNDEQRVVVGDIRCAARHLLQLINDVLDISRSTLGKLELQIEPLCLAAVVDQSLHIARGVALESRIRLEAQVDPELAVLADERRLVQVLHNLLANGIRYSEPGGEVRVRAHREADQIVLEVQDDGYGIPDDEQDRIFDAFVAMKRGHQEPGTGLGLSVCSRLTLAMAGTLTVSSEVGKGSTFTLRLPAATRPADT